mmetsp:Transcript_46307/g.70844  ORF Transcript_46307/g.70844 Transcript_46307/m.70844 type:complete len:240 (+) Transcript_46307:1148-1867(+)
MSKLLLSIVPQLLEHSKQLFVEVAAVARERKAVETLGNEITDAMHHLRNFIGNKAEALMAKHPDDRENDPDGEERVHCQPQGKEGFFRLCGSRHHLQPLVLCLHKGEEKPVRPNVQRTAEGEPSVGSSSHRISWIEVRRCPRQENSKDQDCPRNLVWCANLGEQVVGQQRAGQHVIRVSVVSESNDQRTDVGVVVVHGISHDLAEVADHCEQIHVERDVVLLVIAGEKALSSARAFCFP